MTLALKVGNSTVTLYLFIASALLLQGCQGKQSSLAPQGPAAAQIAWLGWVMSGLGAAIFIFVMALLGAALFRRRPEAQTGAAPSKPAVALARRAETWIIAGGVVMPTVVLLGLFALTVETLRIIEEIVPANDLSNEVAIEVVGRQWWWEINYPGQQVVTANEIHIPAGEPVALQLTSRDVIHSLWVPQLHGKLDLIPGQVDTLVLQADQPGEYYGQCAEFCGAQHAKMRVVVIAETREEFFAWLAAQAKPALPPGDPVARAGLEVFLGSSCAECHTIRGTAAAGKSGPDLTHLASRLTLASGVLENTPVNLAQWIVNPQEVKPGTQMPPAELAAGELQSLLTYLATLK